MQFMLIFVLMKSKNDFVRVCNYLKIGNKPLSFILIHLTHILVRVVFRR